MIKAASNNVADGLEGLIAPIVEAAVRATLERVADEDGRLPGQRLAFPEAEAAALCGLAPHRLRDARRRGLVRGKKVGRVVLIERAELLRFLREQDK